MKMRLKMFSEMVYETQMPSETNVYEKNIYHE